MLKLTHIYSPQLTFVRMFIFLFSQRKIMYPCDFNSYTLCLDRQTDTITTSIAEYCPSYTGGRVPAMSLMTVPVK